jgi:hypothetical protein
MGKISYYHSNDFQIGHLLSNSLNEWLPGHLARLIIEVAYKLDRCGPAQLDRNSVLLSDFSAG